MVKVEWQRLQPKQSSGLLKKSNATASASTDEPVCMKREPTPDI